MILRTERLILRPHGMEAFERYAPMWLTQSMSGDQLSPLHVLSEEQVWARLLRWIGHWQVFGFGPFMVEKLDGGEICGEVGLGYFHRGHGARFDNAPEAMWKISNHCQGQGFAREAMSASLDWFNGIDISERVVCMIDPANLPSIILAEKLGFAEFGRQDYHGEELVLFERSNAA